MNITQKHLDVVTLIVDLVLYDICTYNGYSGENTQESQCGELPPVLNFEQLQVRVSEKVAMRECSHNAR